MLRQMASGNPDETYQPEPMRPEYTDREARLKLMDAQGVERAVVFPSAMALSVENYVKHDRQRLLILGQVYADHRATAAATRAAVPAARSAACLPASSRCRRYLAYGITQ